MFSIKNKKVLLTGATGGIGCSIAKILSSQGAIIALSGTNAEKLESLSNKINSESYVLPCSLDNQEEREILVDKAHEKLGGIDILVCNAAINRDNIAIRMKNDEWNNVIDINLTSTFILNKYAIKKMIRKKWGRIINITSIVGLTGNLGQSNYTASKAGVIGMSKSLALEVSSRNITVNCIAPGFIDTDMTRKLNDVQKTTILSKIPQGKMGTSEDIAHGVAFLASEEASYINGHTLNINGGMLMS